MLSFSTRLTLCAAIGFVATMLLPQSQAHADCGDLQKLGNTLKQAKSAAKGNWLADARHHLYRFKVDCTSCLAQNRNVGFCKKQLANFAKITAETMALLCNKRQIEKDVAMYNCYGFLINRQLCRWSYRTPNWKSAVVYLRQAMRRCSYCRPGAGAEAYCKKKMPGLKKNLEFLVKYLPDKFKYKSYVQSHLRITRTLRDRKSFASARSRANDAMKLVDQCLDDVRPGSADYRVCQQQKKVEIPNLQAEINKANRALLLSRPCPRAKLRDRKLARLMQKAFKKQFRSSLRKEWKLKSLRLDGTRWERLGGIRYQLVDVYACVQVRKRKREPKCQFRQLTFKRTRVGRGWSRLAFYAATTEGSGGIGDFMCKNMK